MKYPAGCLPVTLSRPDELDYEDKFNDFYTSNIKDTLKGADGLPVGVQVISTPFNEEKILFIMINFERT